ncbi:hypothetical protein PT286_02920 [Neisseriaceae bacterium ESL0693]|nr:hypothetical protein [Neisseriaceae bacterium ESL0693]
MNGLLIFKMELFKFFKDKNFLLAAGILSILNIIATLSVIYDLEHAAAMHDMRGMLTFLFLMLLLTNSIFVFIYPFHLIGMDYKNKVMAIMVASGVNRKKLFFSKIGAVVLFMLILMLVLSFIPFLLHLFDLSQQGELHDFTERFILKMTYDYSSSGLAFFCWMMVYINIIIIIALSCILTQGRNLSVLIFIGLYTLNCTVIFILSNIPLVADFSSTGLLIFQLLVAIILTGIFGYIGLKTLERQNL